MAEHLTDDEVARRQFRQIAVEFHNRLDGYNTWHQRWKTVVAFLRLRRAGYRLVHKHGGDYLFIRRPAGAAHGPA